MIIISKPLGNVARNYCNNQAVDRTDKHADKVGYTHTDNKGRL